MPEYLAPGVYVEETSFRPKTIEGVSTSTAAFVGPTRTGPTEGEPRLLTSFADFQRVYGGHENLEFEGMEPRTNYLAYAVRAFFEEGGQRLYVARVFEERDEASSEYNEDGRAAVTVDDVTLEARYPGFAGDMRVIIRAIPSGNVNRSGGEGLTGVRPGDTLLVNPGEGTQLDGSYGINFFDYQVGSDGSPELVSKGNLGNPFPLADLEEDDKVYPFRVRVLIQREQKHPSGGVEFGPEEEIGEYTLHPESGNPLIEGLHPENPSGDPAMTPLLMKEVTDASGTPVTTGVEYADALFNTSQSSFTEAIEVPVKLPNGFGTTGDVEQYEIELNAPYVEILEEIRTQGTITPSSATLDSLTTSNNAATVTVKSEQTPVKGSGTLIYLKVKMSAPGDASLSITSDVSYTLSGGQTGTAGDYEVALPPIEPGHVQSFQHRLEGGNDGKEPTSYETSTDGPLPPDNPEGFDALEDLENVSIVAAPGYTEISDESAALNVQGQLIDHCVDMKYRIAVLDTPSGSTVKDAREWRGNIDSKYAAMYHPWITIFDPRTRSELNVPPSGHVAGIYARNDIENGVHKAPANEVVRSAVGFESRLNKAQQDVLNPEGVNCFRFFEGRGNRLWGARMATSDNEYKYVNIRRYLAYLERSIDEGTQVFVFENNGADLWRNVRRTIGSFLENEWRSNRLMGTTPEEAYFVRCDRSTMTQNDIDNGRLICEIGVALFRPAEFVIFRVGQKLLSDTG